MKALFLCLVSLSVVAYSSGWSLKDFLNNKDISQRSLAYGDGLFMSLVSGNHCISGDLKAAKKELTISNSTNTKVLKVKASAKGLLTYVQGPVCTEYEAGSDGDCLKYETKKREVLLKACNPNQKYYERFTSPVVEFNQMVEHRYNYGSQDLTDLYFSGAVQVNLNPTYGSIDVSLKSWRYATSSKYVEPTYKTIQLMLDPNKHLKTQDKDVVLQVSQSEFGEPTQCKLKRNDQSYSLICSHKKSTLGTIELPLWVLEQIDSQTSFSPVHSQIPNYTLRASKTGETLVAGRDFHSISEMWQLLYHHGKEQACIEYTVANMYSLADKLLSCNENCAGSLLYPSGSIEFIHVETDYGFRVFKTRDVCTKEEGDDYMGYTCLEKRTEKSSVLIPFCS